MILPIFVDTSSVLYALDARDAVKQEVAQRWLTRCWQERSGRLSTQVLNAFYVNLVRLEGEVFKTRARSEVRHLLTWHPCAIDAAMVETAWRVAAKCSNSHWDAQIVAAAMHEKCEILLSENLQHGQVIDGVQIVKPFLGERS